MDPLLLIKSLWPGSRTPSMLEPSPRYSPTVAGLVESHHRNLETAVDLSRKSAQPSEVEPEEQDSEDEAPLDLKVRSVHTQEEEEGSHHQRAEFLRLAEMYSAKSAKRSSTNINHNNNTLPPGSVARVSRESSQERDTHARCQYCGEESDSPDFIPSDHGEAICQRGSLACSLCPKTFTQWNHLHEHKKSHHQKLKQRHYPCQSCGKVFTSASNRNMHQRIHKGVRPFQCTPCGVYFRQKAHLQKHQKTQGHLQASELKEKRLSATEEELGEDSELISSSSGSNSLDSDLLASKPDSSTNNNNNNNNNALLKRSSPKRKQLRPRRTPDEHNNNNNEEVLLENKIRSLVHYNESTHGYECLECPFISHELSALKGHVRSSHLRWEAEDAFKCKDCLLSFSREFNLRIHNKKHENEAGALTCDVCDAVFKVPHFLLKHMEEAHLACGSCGRIQDDKDSLERHFRECSYIEEDEEDMEEEDISVSGGEEAAPLPPPSLSSTPILHISKENRDAKKRKVDSLAESIRLKQERQGSFLSPIPGRKMDMSNIRALLSRPPDPPSGLNALMNHISSLKSDPRRRDPSPPPPLNTTISGSMSLKLVKGHDLDDDNNMGLDLTVGRRRDSYGGEEEGDEEEEESIRAGSGHIPPPFPSSHLNSFSFFGLPPPGADPAFAENLLKLAGLPGPPPTSALHRPPSSSLPNSYIISAALGSSSLPTVFPGLPPNLLPQSPPLHAPTTSRTSSKECPPGRFEVRSHPSSSNSSNSTSTSSSGKPFRCTFCRKEFGHLSSLDSHMEHMHSGESKHTCEICGKSFSSKSNLTAHKKIHSGERPFECIVCHKRFRQKAHLQKHETTHSSATPYRCSICDKAFGHPSNLNTHMATHSNIRPYSCTDCGKSYKDSASFKRHRASHGSELKSCSSCSESFMDLSSLRRHIESTHPDALDSVGEDEEEEESPDKTGNGSGAGGDSGYSSFESSSTSRPENPEEPK